MNDHMSAMEQCAEWKRDRDAARAQVAALRKALERLSHVGIPKYDTDDCHDHADAAEAQILHMRDAAREALALVEDT